MGFQGLYNRLICCLFCLHHTLGGQGVHENIMNDGLKNFTKVIRIFQSAPRGTTVFNVPLNELIDVTTNRLFRLGLSGADRTKFRLSQTALKVDQYPRLFRTLDQRYHVSVEAASMSAPDELLAIMNLEIIVSRKNRHAPKFIQEVYTAEVFRFCQLGRKIAQLQAEDDDEEYYNRKTVYSITTPIAPPMAIDHHNGTVTALVGIRTAPSVVNARILALNVGSPPLQGKANLTVFIRNISEPLNVTVQILNLTSIRVCWHKPRYGRVKKYELRHGSMERPHEQERKLLHLSKEIGRQCTRLRNLASFAENWLEIRAWDPPDPGVPIKIYFHMDKDMCNDHPCYGGKCFKIDREPGYRCICPDGAQGESCEHSFNCDGNDCTIANQINDCDCNMQYSLVNRKCKEKCKRECQNGGSPITNSGRYSCSCAQGYFGESCELFDPCSHIECSNEGTCRNISSTQFKCECKPGYHGETCEHFDPCSREPCLNGGFCRNLTDSEYYCFCYYGFFGQNCTRFDPCASAPCQNNGLCRNLSDSDYMCKCQPGFYGYDCELYSPCLDNPCLHGGMCNSIDGKYVCECEVGRYGKRCEHMNVCLFSRPCGLHSAACQNYSETAYKCICKPGWSDVNCTLFNPCFENPCQGGGMCTIKEDGDFSCECKEGFHGQTCQFRNHCHSSPCKNGGRCLNSTEQGYNCQCKEGFYGNKCENFNPCAKAACMNEAHCVNTSSTNYECICEPPYFGELCQFFNGCYSHPCKHGNCEVTGNSKYECNCELGYFGPECQYFDPCASNPCQNNGECTNLSDEKHECVCEADHYGLNCESFDACHSNPCVAGGCRNLPDGSFNCDCQAGRFGDRCQSTDPCAGKPCLHGGSCAPHDGLTYSCRCQNGFFGSNCESFNPCAENPCKHGGTCIHAGGAKYYCDCSIEFQGDHCESEVPCNSHGKRCYNDGTCKKDGNGTMYCICAEGYYGFRCQNYNPCSSPGACLNGGICQVLDSGMYRCQCSSGFFGDRCEYHRPCAQYFCKNNGTCVHTLKGDICYCREGFKGVICEEDLDECVSNPCRNDGTCRDRPGGYKCECPEGFTGQTCHRAEMCRREMYFEAKGIYVWPPTAHGQTALVECARSSGKYASRECLLRSDQRAQWGSPDTSQCGTAVHSIEEALEALKPFTNVTEQTTSSWLVSEAVRLLEAILPYACENKEVADNMIDIIDHMIGLDKDTIAASNSSDRILAVIDGFMSHVKWLEKNITYLRNNLDLELRRITWMEHDYGTTYSPKNAPAVQITLPQEVFQRDVSSEKVMFLYFKNNQLFLNDKEEWKDLGHVISASLGQTLDIHDLLNCVQYAIPNKEITRHNRCVFWNKKNSPCKSILKKSANRWVADGIETVSYRGPRTTCCASHLTYFSVTADPEVSATTAVEEDFLITVASHGGLGISILMLSIVLFTYSVFRSLNRENFGQLVIQFSGSLLFFNVCTLVGYNRYQIDDDTVCMVVGMLTHYFSLVSLLWSSITAHFVYRSVSTEYVVRERIFLCKRFLLAWGTPAIPLSVAIGVDMESYKKETESCVLSPVNKYLFGFTYLLPVCLIMVANGVVFVLIVKGVCSNNFSKRKADSLGLLQICGTLFIITIVGATWMCAYLSTMHQLIKFSIYFHYTFFGLNGLLGTSLFLFYFLFRAEGRAAWQQCCGNKKNIGHRRRVAGKSNISTATIKGERDYRLVKDRAKVVQGSDRERVFRSDTPRHNIQDGLGPSSARGVPEGGVSRLQVHRPSYRVLHDSESSYPNSPAHRIGRPRLSTQEDRLVRQANTPLRLSEDDGYVHTRV